MAEGIFEAFALQVLTLWLGSCSWRPLVAE